MKMISLQDWNWVRMIIYEAFNTRELVSRVRNTLRRIDRNRWANPLTGLQGNIEIQSEINQRIATKQLFAVITPTLTTSRRTMTYTALQVGTGL